MALVKGFSLSVVCSDSFLGLKFFGVQRLLFLEVAVIISLLQGSRDKLRLFRRDAIGALADTRR